ncbi:MAG: hypothetical protein P4N41_25850 [Negativicutes bacterium]|nr:hypothetical protein [Negativicutes bacterium]MDR3593098.1 hypothetical protein [Negativicutes bacterium]
MEEFKVSPEESVLLHLTPEEVTLIFYVLGIAVAEPLTINELNVLGNALFEMAEVLIVIATQRTLINDALKAQQEKESAEKEKKESAEKEKEEKKSNEELQSKLKKLQEQIQQLQEQINQLKKK